MMSCTLKIPILCCEQEIETTYDVHISTDFDVLSNLGSKNNIFLTPAYFKALKQSFNEDLDLYVIAVFDQNQLLAVFSLHYLKVNGKKSIQLHPPKQFSLSHKFKSLSRCLISKRIAIIGNVLHTNEDWLHWNTSFTGSKKEAIFEAVTKSIYAHFGDQTPLVFKDFYHEQEALTHLGFHQFTVEPNLILDLPKSWNTMEDYVKALSSKYRVRYNKARSKLNGLVSKELSLDDIEKHQNKLHELYKSVISKSEFKLLEVPQNYWKQLKLSLKDDFRMFAYFDGAELKAFYTLILNQDTIDSHYLGFDSSLNTSHQVYLNLLFDMIEKSIQYQKKQLIFARTSNEIKSSVGAVAKPMYSYVKQNCVLSNWFTTQLLNYFNDPKPWVPRTPFK